MPAKTDYLDTDAQSTVAIIKGIDRDVEQGEDILMLGFSLVLMAPLFAPIAPPTVLLPLMALTFAISATAARWHFYGMQRKLSASINQLASHDLGKLRPITEVFAEHPKHSLQVSFNPLKNAQRTVKSILGGLMINPLWMPIFYMLGVQFVEEKQFALLNKAVIDVEQKLPPCR